MRALCCLTAGCSGRDRSEEQPLLNCHSSENPAFWDVFTNLALASIKRLLSFTFFLEMLIIAWQVGGISDGSDPDVASAIVTFQTLANLAAFIAGAPLLSGGLKMPTYFGALERDGVRDQLQLRRVYQRHVAAIYSASGVLGYQLAVPAASLLVFSEDLLLALRQRPGMAAMAGHMCRIFAIGKLGFPLRVASESTMYARGHDGATMTLGLGNLLLATVAAGIAGGGWFGREPDLTALMACFAAENVTTALSYRAWIAWHREFREFSFAGCRVPLSVVWSHYKDLVKDGTTITLVMLIEMGMTYFGMTMLAASLGAAEQAAWSTAMQIMFWGMIPVTAFGAKSAHMFGAQLGRCGDKEEGERDYRPAVQYAQQARRAARLFVTPLCLTMGAFPGILLFVTGQSENEEQRKSLRTLAPIMAVTLFAHMEGYMQLQQLRTVFEFYSVTTINVLASVVSFGLAALLLLQSDVRSAEVLAGAYLFGEVAALIGLKVLWGAKGKPEVVGRAYTQYQARKGEADAAFQGGAKAEAAAAAMRGPHGNVQASSLPISWCHWVCDCFFSGRQGGVPGLPVATRGSRVEMSESESGSDCGPYLPRDEVLPPDRLSPRVPV